MVQQHIVEWVPGDERRKIDNIPHYGKNPDLVDYFTMKIYHGGYIRGCNYIGRKVGYYDFVNKDKMSLLEVDAMVKGIDPDYAYERIDYWYRVGDERQHLMKLETDFDVTVMCTPVPLVRMIILYLDHKGYYNEDPDLWTYEDFISSQPSGVVIEELPKELRTSKGVVIKEVQAKDNVPTQCSIVAVTDPKDKGKEKLLEVPKPPKKAKQIGRPSSSCVGPSSAGSSCVEICSNVVDEFDHLLSFGGELQDDGIDNEGDSEDPDYAPLPDDDDYDKYGEDDYDDGEVFVDEMELEKLRSRNEFLYNNTGQRQDLIDEVEDVDDYEDMFGEQDSDDEPPNYIINSDGEREEAGEYFNPKTDMQNPRFKLGMKFGSCEILKDALQEMAVQGGWEYDFAKNDLVRVRAICKQDNCPFELYASKMQHENTVEIRTWMPKHKCTRIFHNRKVRLKFLVRKFKDRIALNPDWAPDSLADTMIKEIRAGVTTQMAYKVKVAALLELEGSIRYQFTRLKDYANELKRADPATTVDIRCDFNSSKEPVFKRMYICLGALKNGMKSGCRQVIGLDGAFLKSPFGGILLTAVGVDANNCSWVIAYAMVENENKDSWIWFLELLCSDLDIKEDGVGWVFISDKQKGLIPACQEVIPNAFIRFCVRHMWTNFTKNFPGQLMKDQMWKCARDTTMPYFLTHMEEMKALSPKAYDWMTHEDRPPKHWCRAFFNTTSNCDIMDNNICESFNAWIVSARKKPPITMFEEIRWRLMRRIQLRKEKMEKHEDNICPKPRITLEKNKIRAATDCIATFNGGDEAEVKNSDGNKNVVNLRLKTCSCRRWDLTGLPCKHAISAIYKKRHDPDDYVANCYLKKTYMVIYSNLISPVNSMDLWLRCEDPPILPPAYSRQPGRPKTKRVKDASEKIIPTEGKLGRRQKSLKCSNCHQVGHNKKSCQRHLPPKENKRKTNSEEGQALNQTKKARKGPMTLNELRQKVRERAENQRKKYAAAKAAKLAANVATSATSRPATHGSRSTSSHPPQSAPSRTTPVSRPNQSATAPTTTNKAAARIRNRSSKGDGK